MRRPITKQQAEELQSKNSIIRLIDIRSVDEYAKLHVPEAVNIPSEILKGEIASFAKDDAIICICNHGKKRSQQAAETLYNLGFENALYLEGGTAGWFA